LLQLTKPASQQLVLVPSPIWDSWPDVGFLDVYIVESSGRHPCWDNWSVCCLCFCRS